MPTSFEGGNQQLILGPSLKTESDGSFSAGTRSHLSRRVTFSRSISPGAKPPAAVNGSNLLSDRSIDITPLSAIIKIPGAKPPVAATDGHSCGIPGGAPSSAFYTSPGAKPPAAVNGSNLLSDRDITPLSAIIKIPWAKPQVAVIDGHSCGIPGGAPSSAFYSSPGAKPSAAVNGGNLSSDRSDDITPPSAIMKIPGAKPQVAVTDGHSCGIPRGAPLSSACYTICQVRGKSFWSDLFNGGNLFRDRFNDVTTLSICI